MFCYNISPVTSLLSGVRAPVKQAITGIDSKRISVIYQGRAARASKRARSALFVFCRLYGEACSLFEGVYITLEVWRCQVNKKR